MTVPKGTVHVATWNALTFPVFLEFGWSFCLPYTMPFSPENELTPKTNSMKTQGWTREGGQHVWWLNKWRKTLSSCSIHKNGSQGPKCTYVCLFVCLFIYNYEWTGKIYGPEFLPGMQLCFKWFYFIILVWKKTKKPNIVMFFHFHFGGLVQERKNITWRKNNIEILY